MQVASWTLAAALAAQCEQHTSGEAEAILHRADYSSSFPPTEAQQWFTIDVSFRTRLAQITVTVILFGIFPCEPPERGIY